MVRYGDSNDITRSHVQLANGSMIGHFRIIEPISAGGMGEVYLVEDTKLSRKVALKLLPAHACQDADCRARFKREAQALARLDHPNIVSVFEVGEFLGRPFFTMQFVEGHSLQDILSNEPLSIDRILEIGIQVAEGLQAAHEAGVIHRDIKPSNILIDSHGRARIADFGLAAVRGAEHLTKIGTAMGTALYMSPEQVLGGDIDERTDIWSAGVVLFRLFSGRMPFKGENSAALAHAIVYQEPSAIGDANHPVPEIASQVIARCLRKDPEMRFGTAQDMLEALLRAREVLAPTPVWYKRPRLELKAFLRPAVVVPMVLVALFASYFFYKTIVHNARVRWARTELLPASDSLISESQFDRAYFLARTAEQYIPHDPILGRLWARFTIPISIRSSPPGARVSVKEYSASDDVWHYLGTTPIDNLRYPIGFLRMRVEKAGYESFDGCRFLRFKDSSWVSEFTFQLDTVGSIPSNVVKVQGEMTKLNATGDSAFVDDYFLDKYETTNREYKEFVDSGGYERDEFWSTAIVDGGWPLSRDERMATFVDATGRPGPATWELGSYPEGEADYPVGGVSWYEAEAYARFRMKSLPNVFHWMLAASTDESRYIIPESNFDGKGPRPGGKGICSEGAFDMAGNVREWCRNKSGDARCILGGGWNDALYTFNDLGAQPALDRSPTNGIRLIKEIRSSGFDSAANAPIRIPFRDFSKEKPVSDEVYRQYLSFYAYDRSPLRPRVESTCDSKTWFAQKISFDAAYGGERMQCYLYIPKNFKPPLQVAVFFPGSEVIYTQTSDPRKIHDNFYFILRSGRAVAYPIYKGTFERQSTLRSDYPDQSVLWRDHVIAWAKDIGRTIDYLGTRSDIDTSRIAYFGASWGGMMGAIMPAVETRFKAVVLSVAGFSFNQTLPEVDAINFVGHVKSPVLMMDGKWDYIFPYETSQLPLFRGFGVADEHKRLVIYETGHFFLPRNQLMKEVLDWLDKYLGPVQVLRGSDGT